MLVVTSPAASQAAASTMGNCGGEAPRWLPQGQGQLTPPQTVTVSHTGPRPPMDSVWRSMFPPHPVLRLTIFLAPSRMIDHRNTYSLQERSRHPKLRVVPSVKSSWLIRCQSLAQSLSPQGPSMVPGPLQMFSDCPLPTPRHRFKPGWDWNPKTLAMVNVGLGQDWG